MAAKPNHSVTPPRDSHPSGCAEAVHASDLELARRLSATLTVIGKLASRSHDQVLGLTLEKLMELDHRRLDLVDQFMRQILETHDPDVVATFLAWKEHPVLDTILHLTSQLDEDRQYEILDLAEELSSS